MSLNLQAATKVFCEVSVLGLRFPLFFFVVGKKMLCSKFEAKILFCRINNCPDIAGCFHMCHKFCENRKRWVIVLENPDSIFLVYFSSKFS